MKKVLLSLFMALTAMASQAAITVYVQAEKAPHIWAWGAGGDIFKEIGWPGPVLTEKKTVKNTELNEDVELWYYTFDESITLVNILFNDGGNELGQDVKQTKDINGITTDRYFTYDGETTWTDITEQFGGEIPDADVTSVILVGNHNEWSGDDPYTFTAETQGKTYKGTISIDLTGIEIPDNIWEFKIRPNAQGWVGITQVTFTDQPTWCTESMSQGNFAIDLEDDAIMANGPKFKITAEWAGGKDYEWGWTVSMALDNGAGPGPGIKGDVNGDGTVDVADISAIITVMAGGEANKASADVNGDGNVDVADISRVITIMAGGTE